MVKNQNFLKNKKLKYFGIALGIRRILLLDGSKLTGTTVPILNKCNSFYDTKGAMKNSNKK